MKLVSRYSTSALVLTQAAYQIRRRLRQAWQPGPKPGAGTHRFGRLPQNVLDRLARAESRQLETWADRVIDAASLDEIFAED